MRNVFLPRKLNELWQILEAEPGAVLYAGGTDLLVKMRSGLIQSHHLVCLERIDELKAVEDREEEIFIGSCATFTELLQNSLIREHFPVLINGLKVLGSPSIRNMGTIGGNIVTASPAGDTLPPLYVLRAELELKTKNSSRHIPIKDFIKGPGETHLFPGEVLTGIFIRKQQNFNLHHYEKVGQRKALAIAVVSLAALLKISEEGMVEEVRLAWGSVAPTIVTSTEIEAMLIGCRLSNQALERAAQMARAMVKPIDDIRASADYRRQVAGNLLLRLVLKDGKPS
jgi:CO/xanthine dehydrogenase FAD-binding subunit